MNCCISSLTGLCIKSMVSLSSQEEDVEEAEIVEEELDDTAIDTPQTENSENNEE